jgi:hypothetical protein
MQRAPSPRILCLPLIAVLLLISADSPPTQPAAPQPATAPATTPANIPPLNFRWRQVNDAAGGPCKGLIFTSQDASIRYCYGETGGYRWDTLAQRWNSFTDWNPDPQYGHVIGMAIDPNDREVVYYAAGTKHGEVFKSTDRGRTFVATGLRWPNGTAVAFDTPAEGVPTGERIIVDSINSKIVYLATRLRGLWVSEAAGAPGSWKQVESFTARGDILKLKSARGTVSHQPASNGGLSFVALDRRGGSIEANGLRRSRTIFVGVVGDRWADPRDRAERIPESGLWRSNDGGQTWARLATDEQVDQVPARAQIAADGDLWSTISGKVTNVARGGAGTVDLGVPAGRTPIVAMAVDRLDPNHAVVARYGDPADGVYSDDNRLFRTVDGGTTWTEIKAEAASPQWWRKFATRTAVLRFEPNSPKDAHGRSKTLWLGDDIGPWVCDDLDGDVSHWRLISRGRGGQFVPAIASMPHYQGRDHVPLIAATSGFGLFRHRAVSAIPDEAIRVDRSPAGEHRGIASLAFSDNEPQFIVAGSGTGGGKGWIGARSSDNGITWQDLFDPIGKPEADGVVGPIVVGASSRRDRWPPLVRWPVGSVPRYSEDGGKTWADGKGAPAAPQWHDSEPLLAAPLESGQFYLIVPAAKDSFRAGIYQTVDRGREWKWVAPIPDLPNADQTTLKLRVVPPTRELWLAAGDRRSAATRPSASQPAPQDGGLYQITGDFQTWKKIAGWTDVYSLSFGAPRVGSHQPTVVVAGVYQGKLGIFISHDATRSVAGEGEVSNPPHWQQAWENDTTDVPAIIQCLRNVVADRQVYQRIYAGGSDAPRGLFYGEPTPQSAPAAPTNVTATAGKAGVVIEWTDPVGAVEYDVQRAEAEHPNQWQTVAASAWQARIVDSSAKPATKYLYRVVASNALGRSEPSLSVAVP